MVNSSVGARSINKGHRKKSICVIFILTPASTSPILLNEAPRHRGKRPPSFPFVFDRVKIAMKRERMKKAKTICKLACANQKNGFFQPKYKLLGALS